MAIEDFTPTLKALAQMDIDAISSYDQAIEAIKDRGIARRLQEFKEDHVRHVEELSAVIRTYGETPPDFSRDVKGFLMEGLTKVVSKLGTTPALKAMRLNEKLTNRKYREALEKKMPDDLRRLIEQNYGDEQRHLHYLEEIAVEERSDVEDPTLRHRQAKKRDDEEPVSGEWT